MNDAATVPSANATTVRTLFVRYRMLLGIYGVAMVLGACEYVRRQSEPAPVADTANLPPETNAQLTIWPDLPKSHYLRSIQAESLRFDLDESRHHLERGLQQSPKADEQLLYDYAWVLARSNAAESDINAAVARWHLNYPNSTQADPRIHAQLPHPMPGRAASHWPGALSQDGEICAITTGDGALEMWMVDTGNGVTIPAERAGAVRFLLGFTSDRKLLAAVRDDPVVQLHDVDTGEPTLLLTGHAAHVYSFADSQDDNLLATGGADRTVSLWSAIDGTRTRALKGFARPVSALAFSPDGTVLASGTWGGQIRLTTIETDQVVDFDGHLGAVSSLAYSPDGRLLASASRDRRIILWETATGRQHLTLEGHNGPVCSVRFSADGQSLLSGSADRTARIWYVEDGRLDQTITARSDVFSATFSPDEESIVVACVDGTAWRYSR